VGFGAAAWYRAGLICRDIHPTAFFLRVGITADPPKARFLDLPNACSQPVE
jgi:hypothetical protein